MGYGLRNPWRFSFDRATGDLYIGDVGQNSWEEVDFTPRRSPGLENYGWDVYEGRARFENKPLSGSGKLVRPVVVYPLSGGHCAVSGGFVYRGNAVPAAKGRYFYGDNCSGTVWSFPSRPRAKRPPGAVHPRRPLVLRRGCRGRALRRHAQRPALPAALGLAGASAPLHLRA